MGYKINGVEVKVGQTWRTRGGGEEVVTGFEDHPDAIITKSGFALTPQGRESWVQPGGHDRDLLELISEPTGGVTVSADEKAAVVQSQPSPASAIQIGGGHYKTKPVQPWDYVAANNLGFFEGNVVKYVTRWKDKGGVADLRKARHYLDKLIELQGEQQ